MGLSRFLVTLGFLLILPVAYAQADDDDDFQNEAWQENDYQLPAAPKKDSLLPFYVSAASENRFFIDGATLSVGSDGVVRYVLVVLAPEGGRNVTFEGMRCETHEHRLYASGRLDGSWSKARNSEWGRIQEVYANRQHAALFLEYFCPNGIIVGSADEARRALRQGGHPDSKHW